MKIDPKLLRELEKRGDANAVLADALGVCPTCGQAMPTRAKAANPRPNPRPSRMRDAVIEYLTKTDTEFGNQSRCARALDTTNTYVNKIWSQYRREQAARGGAPHDEADE